MILDLAFLIVMGENHCVAFTAQTVDGSAKVEAGLEIALGNRTKTRKYYAIFHLRKRDCHRCSTLLIDALMLETVRCWTVDLYSFSLSSFKMIAGTWTTPVFDGLLGKG